MYRKNGLTNLR